jgi:molecular chaperone GrpE
MASILSVMYAVKSKRLIYKKVDMAGKEIIKKEERTKSTVKKSTASSGSGKKKKTTPGKDDIKAKIKSCEQKINELADKYLRLSAEFDNYRKRTLKEKIELTKSAGEELLRNILPVMDDFERALQTIDNAKEITAVKLGINHIYTKFKEFLNQYGVKEIDANEKDFNIDFHEAVTKIPVEKEGMKGKVVDVIEKGYTLNDKVLRYSKVVVGE